MIEKVKDALSHDRRGSNGFDRFVDKAFYAVAMAGFGWVFVTLNGIKEDVSEAKGRTAVLQQRITQLESTQAIRRTDSDRITQLEVKLENIGSTLSRIEKKLNSR